jgi:hypothetical protein
MWLALMLPSSKQSLMKWYLMQMCLILMENRVLGQSKLAVHLQLNYIHLSTKELSQHP